MSRLQNYYYNQIALDRMREAEERNEANRRKLLKALPEPASRGLTDEDWKNIARRKNPFAKASFNLTDQCRLMKIDPEFARQLQARAKAEEVLNG